LVWGNDAGGINDGGGDGETPNDGAADALRVVNVHHCSSDVVA
jgi:hypothetical protein